MLNLRENDTSIFQFDSLIVRRGRNGLEKFQNTKMVARALIVYAMAENVPKTKIFLLPCFEDKH